MKIRCSECLEEMEWDGRSGALCDDCGEKKVAAERQWRVDNLDKVLADAWIPKRYRRCTREAWKGDWPLPPEEDESTTLIYGPVGRGKSHLATAMLIEHLIEKGQGKWAGCSKLIGDLKRSFDETGGKGSALMTALIKAPILVLDDFPPDHMTEFSLGTLTELMHIRYDEMRETIITTNLPLIKRNDRETDLADISARLASRFGSGRVIELSGKHDRRIIPVQ